MTFGVSRASKVSHSEGTRGPVAPRFVFQLLERENVDVISVDRAIGLARFAWSIDAGTHLVSGFNPWFETNTATASARANGGACQSAASGSRPWSETRNRQIAGSAITCDFGVRPLVRSDCPSRDKRREAHVRLAAIAIRRGRWCDAFGAAALVRISQGAGRFARVSRDARCGWRDSFVVRIGRCRALGSGPELLPVREQSGRDPRSQGRYEGRVRHV
jgi:hypothetical protein